MVLGLQSGLGARAGSFKSRIIPDAQEIEQQRLMLLEARNNPSPRGPTSPAGDFGGRAHQAPLGNHPAFNDRVLLHTGRTHQARESRQPTTKNLKPKQIIQLKREQFTCHSI